MSDALVLFLPDGDAGWRWLRIHDARVAEAGEGIPVGAGATLPPPTVIAPAPATALHWADLPAASERQAAAAARLLAAEASAEAAGGLHVAVGRTGSGTERPIGVVAAPVMRDWLDQLAGHGIDPAAIIPAPLLLPRPETGYLRADLGGVAVVRGVASGFADDPILTGLVVADESLTDLERAALDPAIVAAIAAPPLDLRQGPFARRRRIALDRALIGRLARLAAAILIVTVLTNVVRLVRYQFDAERIEAQADRVARSGLPRGEPVTDAARQLDARLAGLRGAGQGFSATGAALAAAIQATAGSELTALAFDPGGTLRATISTETEGQAAALRDAMVADGFVVSLSPLSQSGGRLAGELTVAPI